MKKHLNVLLAGLVLAQSVTSIAEPGGGGGAGGGIGPVVPVIGGGQGGSSVVFGQSGDIKLEQEITNNTEIVKELMKQNNVNQKLDRDYLESVVKRLNDQLQAMAALKLRFNELSQKSATQGFISLEEYFNLVNQINNTDQVLKNELQTQTLITRESLPSYQPIQIGEKTISQSTSGNVDMTKVMTRIDALRVAMMTEMNNMTFPNVQSRLGQMVPGGIVANALSPKLTGIRVLTEDEIKDKRKIVQTKLTLAADTQEYADRYADVMHTNILNFINDYGVDEWARLRSDNDLKAREVAFARIVDGFFRRSYLRQKYKLRLGALRPADFDKKFLNIEDFTYQPVLHALKSLERVAAQTEPDVLAAFEDARNWVELYDKKLTPVFASSEEILAKPEKLGEYASQNTGILIRANAAINTITGQKAATEALLMIMRLVLADSTEELMMYGNENQALNNYHRAKYRVNADMDKQYFEKVCAMDFYLADAVVNKYCGGKKAKLPSSFTSGKSIQEIFNSILFQIETVEKGRRQEAELALQLIEAALAAGQNLTEEQRQQQDQDALDMFE